MLYSLPGKEISPLAGRKSRVNTLPRGVTVTQRPLEALFMVRIHAR